MLFTTVLSDASSDAEKTLKDCIDFLLNRYANDTSVYCEAGDVVSALNALRASDDGGLVNRVTLAGSILARYIDAAFNSNTDGYHTGVTDVDVRVAAVNALRRLGAVNAITACSTLMYLSGAIEVSPVTTDSSFVVAKQVLLAIQALLTADVTAMCPQYVSRAVDAVYQVLVGANYTGVFATASGIPDLALAVYNNIKKYDVTDPDNTTPPVTTPPVTTPPDTTPPGTTPPVTSKLARKHSLVVAAAAGLCAAFGLAMLLVDVPLPRRRYDRW